MATKKNTLLHIVQTDPEEEAKKNKERRRKRAKRLLIVIVIAAALAALFFVQRNFRSYDSYQVLDSESRYDTETTRFTTFGDYLVRYSTDGATCTDQKNRTVWAVPYEMSSPTAIVKDSYMLIADLGGKTLLIVDEDGEYETITTDLPILRADIAGNGRTAALLTEGDICYLNVYDESGDKVAGGEFHDGSGGYPMDIALSDDGYCIALTALTIESGESSSRISFYDFSADSADSETGTQESTFTYEGTVIPDVEFVSASRLLAYGDDRVLLFSGTTDPQEDTQITLDDEVKAVFCGDEYFGLLMRTAEDSSGNAVLLYRTDGTQAGTITTEAQYSDARFLGSGEICLTNGTVCAIYTTGGHCKYYGESDSDFYEVVSTGFFRRYIFARQDITEIVQLHGLNYSR